MTTGPLLTVGLPLATLLIGASFGLFSSVLLENKRQANSIAAKVVEAYIGLRQQLADELCDLANLKVDKLPDVENVAAKLDAISRLYYRHYDFMPKRVLQELNCLYACLSDKENRLYVIHDDELVLADEDDVLKLIEQISLVANFKYYALIPLRSENSQVRRATAINYQARRVLRVVNQDLSIKSLLRWSRDLKK